MVLIGVANEAVFFVLCYCQNWLIVCLFRCSFFGRHSPVPADAFVGFVLGIFIIVDSFCFSSGLTAIWFLGRSV